MPPPTNHWRGAVIVYLLFTEEKPHYFLLINNWHVWVGWGTKSHSLSVFFPSGCVFMCVAAGQTVFFLLLLCVKADNRLSSPHGSLSAWALSSPHGFFVCAELQVISGNTLNYLMLHSTRKGRISNFLHTVYGYVYCTSFTDCWNIPHPMRPNDN